MKKLLSVFCAVIALSAVRYALTIEPTADEWSLIKTPLGASMSRLLLLPFESFMPSRSLLEPSLKKVDP